MGDSFRCQVIRIKKHSRHCPRCTNRPFLQYDPERAAPIGHLPVHWTAFTQRGLPRKGEQKTFCETTLMGDTLTHKEVTMFDDLADERMCPTCCEPQAKLWGMTDHITEVHAANLVRLADVEQGKTLEYVCESCGHRFSLLDRPRRAWFVFGLVVGALIAAFGAWLNPARKGVGVLCLVVGIIAVGTSMAFLARDYRLRKRTALSK